MAINFEFNFWDNSLSILSILISSFVAIWIYQLSKRLTAADKYKHEVRVVEKNQSVGFDRDVILADITKYHPLRSDDRNKTYYKQGAVLYSIVPEYGVQFVLRGSDERIPVGLVPFGWIEYVRGYDSEDNKPIIVCKFKGVKWYKRFKSPFREISYMYRNPYYDKDTDPTFMMLTTIKPEGK